MIKTGLTQAPEQWAARNNALATALLELLKVHHQDQTRRALDLGCQTTVLTDLLVSATDLTWWGVDPQIESPRRSPAGAELRTGWAHDLPFPDAYFDCVIFANVYEHVAPGLRFASLAEISRVLVPGGLLLGQLPNPYFPIESHSRLPFMGWLPESMRERYWRLSPVEWKATDRSFYSVTIGDLRAKAQAAGLEVVVLRNFNYPIEAIPPSVRWCARLLAGPMRLLPWSWQFVFRKV